MIAWLNVTDGDRRARLDVPDNVQSTTALAAAPPIVALRAPWRQPGWRRPGLAG